MGLPVTKAEFVAQQLRSSTPDVDWNINDVDRAMELGRIMSDQGVTDLWALKLKQDTLVIEHPEFEGEWPDGSGDAGGTTWMKRPAYTEHITGYYFDYYGRRIGYIGTQDRVDMDPHLEYSDDGYLIAWSSAGHGAVGYVVRPDNVKKTLQIVPIWTSSSDTGFIRFVAITAIAFFAASGYDFGFTGTTIGATVGQAVVTTEFAAAYPALTAAIGNVAVSAALNGGDVEAAVQSVVVSNVAGFGGAQVGGVVSSVTDSVALGAVANVAARTAIMGGDVERAVAFELVNQGAVAMDDWNSGSLFDSLYDPAAINSGSLVDQPFGFQNMDYQIPDMFPAGGFDFNVSLPYESNQFTAPGDFNSYDPVITFDVPTLVPTEIPAVTYDPTVAEIFPDPIQWNPYIQQNNILTGGGFPTASDASVITPNPQYPAPPNSPSYSPSQVVQGITNATMSAINLVKAYRSLDTPAVQTMARVVRPNGSVSVIGNNGLVQTRTPAGAVSAARPPVGVPQATLDGNYVVNNGDNTYSLISPTGQIATFPYAEETSPLLFGLPQDTLLMIGGGAVALLLLTRNRRT